MKRIRNLSSMAVTVVLLLSTINAIYASSEANQSTAASAFDTRYEGEISSGVQKSSSYRYLLSQPDPENPQDENRNPYVLYSPVSANDSATSLPPSSPLIDTAVKITNNFGEHVAIGTKISENTILTHNHQKSSLDAYTTVDSSGANYTWVGAMSDPVGRSVVLMGQRLGQQTRLVTYSQSMAGNSAKIASEKTIRGIQVGDLVDIVFWDDDRNQFAVGQFTISDIGNLRNGTISYDNSKGILNPGDSGGGVFYNSELIGNLWGVAEVGFIALIPPKVTERSEGNSTVEQVIARVD